ncbi:hypothetical protein [Mongoliimonas terrestris]|uniref:hypothetical protein n=1 Tax=Mongoliimonas terrestris TaxID=1709001 RepID=UPI000949965C|nr:hypothetical protein [Mongoliimonas terrestris]
MDPWHLAFGTEMNVGQNSASVNAGNGIGNQIDGSVVAEANQTVGDFGFDFGYETNSADVFAANGLLNDVDGDIAAIANQTVGDADFLPILF